MSYMHRELTSLFRRAIRSTTASVRTVAEEAGFAHVTFDKYLNERPPSRRAVLSLAEALEKRSKRLSELSIQLRDEINDHGA